MSEPTQQPDGFTIKALADAIGIAECLFNQEHGSLGSLEDKWMYIATTIMPRIPIRESITPAIAAEIWKVYANVILGQGDNPNGIQAMEVALNAHEAMRGEKGEVEK